MRWAVASLALLLLALPGLPPAAAQTAESSPYVAAFDDEFNVNFGWTATATTGTPAGNAWHHVGDPVSPIDGVPRSTWFASRVDANGVPAGYANNVGVTLTSPRIDIPEGLDARSVVVVLRGSSLAPDALTLQWFPGEPAVAATAPAEQWETLKAWSGHTMQSSYSLQDVTSAKFLAHKGALTLRFVFTSDGTCDSNPGDALPGPGPLLGYEPDPTVEPNPDDPPGTVDPGPTPPPPGAGEASDLATCPKTSPSSVPPQTVQSVGWFLDRVMVVARRDFVAAAGPSAPRIPVDGLASDAVQVDLIADMGDVFRFTLDESQVAGPFTSMAALLLRTGSSDQISVHLQKGPGSTWSGELAVNEPELTKGSWTAYFYGIGSQDGAKVVAQRTLEVAAADQVAPSVSILPAAAAGQPIRLGPGSALQVNVQEPLLRRVTYSYPGLPAPLDMAFPFNLPEAALPEGPSQVTIVAVDRVGLSTTRTVSVDRDTIRPGVALNASSVVYGGVPFDLEVRIVERSAHKLTLDANGTVLSVDVPAAAAGEESSVRTQTLSITPPGTGDFTVTARVQDLVGNEAFVAQQFTAVKPVTDLTVSDVRLASDRNGVVREGQTFVATVEQVGGVAPLPVTVVFEAAGRTTSFNVTVPASGPLEVTWNATLRGGTHTVVARAIGPAIANETNPGNEERSAQVEVFLGRITVGKDIYVIRADSRGLPAVALLSGSSKTYPLTVVDQGAGIAYQFTIAGNRTLTWDPLVPVSSVAEEDQSEEDGKKAPFPGLVMVLLVLAMAALAQRRRWT